MIKERDSNIELMRIVSMLMVLNLHSMSGPSIDDSFSWQAFDFFRESTSICAIHLFVIASGYFGIKWKMRSFVGLIFQILFYFWIIIGICSWLSFGNPIEVSGWQLIILPFTKGWWFITSYLLLYLIAPLLNNINGKLPLYCRIVFVSIIYVACVKYDYYSIGLFTSLYLIGSILRSLKDICISNNLINRLLIVKWGGYLGMSFLITTICLYLFTIDKIDVISIKKNIIGWEYHNPLIMLQSVFLFNIFNGLKIKNQWINKAAISVLAVYLIHMHPCIKNIYYSYTKSFYELEHILHILVLMSFLPICLVVCLLIDKVRLYLFRRVCNLMD